MNNFEIKPASFTHLNAIVLLQLQAYTDELAESADVLGSRIAHGGAHSFVATSGDALVGYVLAHRWPDHSSPGLGLVMEQTPPDSTVIHLHDMAVAPEFRGSGIAQALLNALEQSALEVVDSITLVAVQGAQNFWARVGFEDEGPVPNYDAGARFMRKRLTT